MIVMLIGPVVIVIALGMIASLKSNTMIQFFLNSEFFGPIFLATSKLTPYLLVTGVFTFVYMYMPNTRVRFKSAFVGGLAGGIAWATISVIFATFVVAATRTQLIYSGFAVAITTLIWLYLNWLVLLIGAQLAFYFQNPAFLRIGRREPRLSNAMRERLALNIMLLVGRAFRKGETSTESVHSLARTLRIPSITLTPIILGLETDGLLMSTEDEDLVPGREMSRIPLNEILSVVREHGETGSYRDPKWADEIMGLGDEVDAAIATTVGDQSLADLLDKSDG
jgi:membrane protein